MSKKYTFRQAIRSVFGDYQDELLRIIRESTTKHSELLDEFSSLKELLILLTNKNFTLENGLGDEFKAKINKYGALKTFSQAIPDIDDPTLTYPITGFLTDENNNTDGLVNASLADPIDFFVKADQESDIFISAISFKIVDQNSILSNFGNIAALTNGCQLIYSTTDLGEVVLADNLQTNYDFVRLCFGNPAFSANVSAFRADNVVGNSEGYIPSLNFAEIFGINYGIRLRKDSLDRLILRVRDNVSQIDAFDFFYYGNRNIS